MPGFGIAPVDQDECDRGGTRLVGRSHTPVKVQARLERGLALPAGSQVELTVEAKLQPRTPADLPTHVLIPAYALSEVKTAFQMGFVLFLPFLVIDMVVASVLMSMGMMMLPPVVVSLPFKLIFFVLVDGWRLVAGSLVESYMHSPPPS